MDRIKAEQALKVLAEFVKTAPGRLPQAVQDAIAVAATPSDTAADQEAERREDFEKFATERFWSIYRTGDRYVLPNTQFARLGWNAALEAQAAAPRAEPVAWVSPSAIEWLRLHDGMMQPWLFTGRSDENDATAPLYLHPPAASPSQPSADSGGAEQPAPDAVTQARNALRLLRNAANMDWIVDDVTAKVEAAFRALAASPKEQP